MKTSAFENRAVETTSSGIPLLAVAAILFSLAAAGCGGTVAEPKAPAAPKVTVGHPVQRELVDEEDFSGWLEASATVEVRARVRGHIQKIHFKDGDIVESEQLLFELDPRPFQISIDQATAQSKAYEAQKNAAEKDVARYTELVKTGGASQQQLEKAQADADSYDAQINAMKEQVRQFELDLEFSRVTAPIAGRISRAMLTEGNLVNAGGSDPLLTTIAAITPINVYFSVDERTLQRTMRKRAEKEPEKESATPKPLRERQMPFRFGLDSDTGYPNEGTLDFADNKVDSQTGTIQVRGVVDNTQGKFVPGSRVKVRVPVSEPYTAVIAADTAILSDQDKRYVLAVDEKNVVTRRDITPGKLLDDGMRVILPAAGESQGLTPADRIIVLGLQRARINYPVEPLEEAVAAKSD
ncbi:MAG TPA: efflux RND transporter periplasmic adaptor subunit, partial [Planctomycetaceae bacterium]|nr:efflux RND transporter periplasmic adaptor subunit [Planctomycetaceae bacterium]